MKFHYLMINFEHRYDNYNYMKEIYENINDIELIKEIGAEIHKRDRMQRMEYNAFALHKDFIFTA